MRVTGLQTTIQSAFGGKPGALAWVMCGNEMASIYGDWELSIPLNNPVAADHDGKFPEVYVAIYANGPRDEEGAVVSVHSKAPAEEMSRARSA